MWPRLRDGSEHERVETRAGSGRPAAVTPLVVVFLAGIRTGEQAAKVAALRSVTDLGKI